MRGLPLFEGGLAMSPRFQKAAHAGDAASQNPYREIQRHFDQAIMKREIEAGFTSEDWRDYRQIVEDHAARKEDAEATYRAEYDERVTAARRALIDQAANRQPALRHPWFPSDNFSRDRIDREAHRLVRSGHEGLLQSLERQQSEAMAPLYERAKTASTDQASSTPEQTSPNLKQSRPNRQSYT